MKQSNSVKIAGDRTVEDWKILKAKLLADSTEQNWLEAFKGFFCERLNTRYFEPIKLLSSSRRQAGEGFAIVTIQCSIIEFLGSTMKGTRYRFLKKREKLGKFEYAGSKAVFIDFLKTATPFSEFFDQSVAEDFYEGVRCGLLHEARTKRGWTINTRPDTGAMIDATKKIVWRDDIQRGLELFVQWYGRELAKDKELQQAFIRKFDFLCE